MECKKLEKKIQDWARSLGFKLPDESAPPANYFGLLTATPHRRQLWETLIESVQPRQKVELMRKQIFVAKLKEKKKIPKKNDWGGETDKIDLWHKQNELEDKVKSQKNEIVMLERNIIMRISDLLFEICKLSEMEKTCDEFSERELALRLFSKREKDITNSLEELLMKAGKSDRDKRKLFSENSVGQKSSDHLKKELLNVNECNGPFSDGHRCEMSEKLRNWCESEASGDYLWEEVIKCKKSVLENFSAFLDELDSNEKTLLSEKESEIEKNVNVSITHLRQKVTEKSLQVILNCAERRSLEYEIERLIDILLDGRERTERNRISIDGMFDELISPIERSETRESLAEGEGTDVLDVKNAMEKSGLKGYESFLKEEAKRLDEEVEKIERERKKKLEREKESQKEEKEEDCQFFESESVGETISKRSEREEELSREIIRSYERLSSVLRSSAEETEQKKKATAVQNAENLKIFSRKLVQTFLETPFDAFRTVETSDGRLIFECESPSHCLSSSGGELAQFLSAALLPPEGNVQNILSEVERRRKMAEEIRKFIRRREELSGWQREAQKRLSSIKWDTRLCERNFAESDAILCNVFAKAEEIPEKIRFIEKILKNWVEQPYRSMVGKAEKGPFIGFQDVVGDTTGGLSFIEFR